MGFLKAWRMADGSSANSLDKSRLNDIDSVGGEIDLQTAPSVSQLDFHPVQSKNAINLRTRSSASPTVCFGRQRTLHDD